ncbi:MAG: HAD hydrolase-like protein, partial [Deltaproteobacteria bacterium]|nr:HAD hydrolase-like protein [Kofleriaceae bacterium]
MVKGVGATSIRAIIFDLDGTLVDSLEDIAAALGGALADAGLARPPLAVVRAWIGDGARSLVER